MRRFPALGKVLIKFGECAYSMLQDGIINICTVHFDPIGGELIPRILDPQNSEAACWS